VRTPEEDPAAITGARATSHRRRRITTAATDEVSLDQRAPRPTEAWGSAIHSIGRRFP